MRDHAYFVRRRERLGPRVVGDVRDFRVFGTAETRWGRPGDTVDRGPNLGATIRLLPVTWRRIERTASALRLSMSDGELCALGDRLDDVRRHYAVNQAIRRAERSGAAVRDELATLAGAADRAHASRMRARGACARDVIRATDRSRTARERFDGLSAPARQALRESAPNLHADSDWQSVAAAARAAHAEVGTWRNRRGVRIDWPYHRAVIDLASIYRDLAGRRPTRSNVFDYAAVRQRVGGSFAQFVLVALRDRRDGVIRDVVRNSHT